MRKTELHTLILGFSLIVGLASSAFAQVDSTEILFDDASVRNYAITFYATDWQAQLTAAYAADSGYVLAKFSDGVITLDSIGVRYKGNSSYTGVGTSPKKPLKIKFNEFVSGQTYYGVKILNFSNGYMDPTLLREKVAYDISRKYMPTPRANFSNIRINGSLIGLYTQVEQADKSFLERWFAADPEQNLFKAGDNGSTLQYLGTTSAFYDTIMELKTNESANDWSGMIGFITFINQSSDADFCSGYGSYMNLDNVAKFMAFNMVLSHFDSYTGSGRNYYMYQQFGNSFMTFIPWDMNLAFGGYTNGWNVYTQKALAPSNIASRPLLKKILSCQETKYQYLGWIREMINGYAATDSVQVALTRLSAIIRPSVEADPNKFYTIGAFDTNQTSKYRASATAIFPGIIELSTTRNANLLKEVTDSLPANFILPLRNVPKLGALSLRRVDGGWLLQGAENLGSYRVDYYRSNGVRAGFQEFASGQVEPLREMPQGLVVLRVKAKSQTSYYSINNY